jgi:hypothetical protein
MSRTRGSSSWASTAQGELIVTSVPAADRDTDVAGAKANRWLVRLSMAAAALLVLCMAGLAALIFATSGPEILVASPNDQVQVSISEVHNSAAAQTGLAYENAAQPQARDAGCGKNGRWSLDVNPEDVVGHPYAALPRARDWLRAAAAISTARSICLARVVLRWYGHDPAHPTSDAWTALLPASLAATINGPTLRRYALHHAQHM